MNTIKTDEHTVTIFCDMATAEQIEAAFRIPIQKWVHEHPDATYDTTVEVALMTLASGDSCQWCFVRFEDRRFFHLFTGNNEDGTPQVILKQADAHEVEKRRVNLLLEMNKLRMNATSQSSWADEMDIEDIRRELAELDKPVHVEEVTEVPILKAETISLNNRDLELELIPAHPGTRFDDRIINALTTCDVPSWVTPEMLKVTFRKYARDSETKYAHRSKQGVIPDTYPMVSTTTDRYGKSWMVVKFDPAGIDAYYAGVMHRKMLIQHDGKEKTLCFQHPKFHGWSFLRQPDALWRESGPRDRGFSVQRSAMRHSSEQRTRPFRCPTPRSTDSDSISVSLSSDSFLSSTNSFDILDSTSDQD